MKLINKPKYLYVLINHHKLSKLGWFNEKEKCIDIGYNSNRNGFYMV